MNKNYDKMLIYHIIKYKFHIYVIQHHSLFLLNVEFNPIHFVEVRTNINNSIFHFGYEHRGHYTHTEGPWIVGINSYLFMNNIKDQEWFFNKLFMKYVIDLVLPTGCQGFKVFCLNFKI